MCYDQIQTKPTKSWFISTLSDSKLPGHLSSKPINPQEHKSLETGQIKGKEISFSSQTLVAKATQLQVDSVFDWK